MKVAGGAFDQNRQKIIKSGRVVKCIYDLDLFVFPLALQRGNRIRP